MRAHRIVCVAAALCAVEATSFAQTMADAGVDGEGGAPAATSSTASDASVATTNSSDQGPPSSSQPTELAPITVDTRPPTADPPVAAEQEPPTVTAVAVSEGAFQRPYPWERENWLALVFGIGFGGGYSGTVAGSLEAYYQRWFLKNVGFGARFGGVGLGQNGSIITGVVIEPGVVVGARGVGIAGYVRVGAGAMLAAVRSTGSLDVVNVIVSGETGMQLFPWAGQFGLSFAARLETYQFAAWSLQLSSGVGGRF